MSTKRTVVHEQFFTTEAVVARCFNRISQHFALEDFSVIVEPSAGAGAFFDKLPTATRHGIDIDPPRDDLIRQDFLEWRAPEAGPGQTLVIGNPPFGQRAQLAVLFLKKACSFADVVAFILPRSFKKYTFQNRVPRNFHLLSSDDVEDFQKPDGSPVQVKAVFQVWEKRSSLRELELPPNDHHDFELKHAHLSRTSAVELAGLRAHYDFAIAQVGSNFLPRDVDEIEKGSYWFVRGKRDGLRDLFTKLNFDFLDDKNTAHKSLSRRDIVTAYLALDEISSDQQGTHYTTATLF